MRLSISTVLAGTLAIALTSSALAQSTILQWNFNAQTLAPSTLNSNFQATPSISMVGGANQIYITGSNKGSSSDPNVPNNAIEVSNFPAQGAGNGTAGVQYNINTTGFTLNNFSYDREASGGPSGWSELEYSVNGGSTWNPIAIPNPTNSPNVADASGSSTSGSGIYEFFPNDVWTNQGAQPWNPVVDLTTLPLYSQINNNPNFEIRDVAVFSPVAFTDSAGSHAANTAYMRADSSNATTGAPVYNSASAYTNTSNWRIDMVTVTGTFTPPAFTPVNLTWNAGSGTWDTVATNQPWLNGVAASPFHQNGGLGDNVTFNNPANGSVVTIQPGGVTPNSMNIATNGTLTFTGGSIGGTGGLTKTGSGTLVLNNSNTFTGASSGGSTITGGTLETHATSPLGSGPVSLDNVQWNATTNPQTSAGTVTLNDNVTIDTAANLNLSGGIAGAGNLSKTGAGTLEIGGIGTNTGTINVTQGTVQLDSMSALGGNPVTPSVAPAMTFSNSNLVFNSAGKSSTGADSQLSSNVTLNNANVSRNDLNGGVPGSSTSNGDSVLTAFDSNGNYFGGVMSIGGSTTLTNNEHRTAAASDTPGPGTSGSSNQLGVSMPVVITNGATLTANATNGALSVVGGMPTGQLANTAVAFHGVSVLSALGTNDSITLDAGGTLAFTGAGEKRIGSGSNGLPVVGLGTSASESTFKADTVTFMSDAVTDVNKVNSLFVVAGTGLGGLRIEAPMNANYFSNSSTPDPTTGQIATSGLFGNNPDTSSTSPGNVYTIMSPNRYAGLSGFTNMPTQTADGTPLPALGGTLTLASTTAGTGAVDNGPAAGTAVQLGLDNTTATPGAVTYTLDAASNGAALNNFGGLVLRQTGSASVTAELLTNVALQGNNSAATTYTQLGGTLNLNGHSFAVGAAANISGGEIMGASSTFAANSINVTAGAIAPESGPSTPGTLTLTGNTLLGHSAILNYELGAPGTIGGGINSLTEVQGNLTLSGVLDVAGLTGFGAGTYRLMDYTGSLVNNTLSIGTLPAGFTATIDLTTAHEVNLVVTQAAGSLQGDVNHDGIVNSQDLAIVSSQWQQGGSGLVGDVNHDNIVNSQDLAIVSSQWQQTGPSGGAQLASAVPEPSSYVLCLMGVVVSLGWRSVRRRTKVG